MDENNDHDLLIELRTEMRAIKEDNQSLTDRMEKMKDQMDSMQWKVAGLVAGTTILTQLVFRYL